MSVLAECAAVRNVASWTYDDGGRREAGFSSSTGDCVCRAIAIATGLAYKTVYDDLAEMSASERRTKRRKRQSHPRTGVRRGVYQRYLFHMGWKWQPTMQVGQGCKVHLRSQELPAGRLIVALSKHLTCMVDGVVHDTYDCSRDGTRCVYGYYYLPGGDYGLAVARLFVRGLPR